MAKFFFMFLKHAIILMVLVSSAGLAEQQALEPSSLEKSGLERSVHWQEGFFVPGAVPKGRGHAVENSLILQGIAHTGVLANPGNDTLSFDSALSTHQQMCANEAVGKWYKSLCERISQCLQDQREDAFHCPVASYRHFCSGVILAGGYFVTAKHCRSAVTATSVVRVWTLATETAVDYAVEATALSDHHYPYDVSVFKLPEWRDSAKALAVSWQYQNNMPVYSIGFPDTAYRTEGFNGYPKAAGDLRLTFGYILDANLHEYSFCRYSNNIAKAEPMQWELAPSCPYKGSYMTLNTQSQGFRARREHNPLLVNIDMISGMSGAPLFNMSGELLGIGSTVLKNDLVLNYSPAHPAVYVKSKHIIPLLNALR